MTTEIDVTNPDCKEWRDYTSAERAAHYTALAKGGDLQAVSSDGWEKIIHNNRILSGVYRVIPAPIKTSRTYEMQLAAWDRADGPPIMSSCQTGHNWQQGTTTVYFEDGKPVRAVWEVAS